MFLYLTYILSGSTTKEESDLKPEPAKTRGRRSSATTEHVSEEEPKPQTIARRRRSGTTENSADPEIVKPVRTRRGSASEKPVEEEPAKRITRARRGSVKDEEPKEEPVKKTTRSRRGSVDKAEETEPVEKRTNTRGRRSSTDELEGEPEPKTIKLTPVKSKRRPSVTENVVNLETIQELESDIKGSPHFKESIRSVTPVKSAEPTEVKGSLNLSVIDETSFTEEAQDDKYKGGERVAAPRRSPRLNKLKSPEKLASPRGSPNSHKISSMEENQSLERDPTKEEECTKELLETKEEHLQLSPRKLAFADESHLAPDIEIDRKAETSSISIEASIREEQLKKNEEGEKSLEKDYVSKKEESLNISLGSDGSFNFNFDISITASQNENVQEKDDLNSSKSSNASDKENVDANTRPSPSAKKTMTEEKIEVLNSLTNTPGDDKNPIQQEVVVARVSNVFRPTMKENSFVEPMEVDEYPSMLDPELGEPEESKIEDVTAVSTPRAKENLKNIDILKKPVNKNVLKESLGDMDNDSVEESFYLFLNNSQEDKDELRDVSQTKGQDSETKTPEKFSEDENCKSAKGAVEDSTEEDKAKLETVGEKSVANEEIVGTPVKNVESITFKEEVASKVGEITAAESDLEKTSDQSVSYEETVIPQDTKKNQLSISPYPSDKHLDLKSNSSQQMKEQEEKNCDPKTKDDENIKINDTQKRRSRSPLFIHLEVEGYSSNEKTSSRKSKSPQLQHSPKTDFLRKDMSLRRSKSPQPIKGTIRKSKSPQPSSRRSKSPQFTKDVTRKSKSPQRNMRRSKSPQPAKEKMPEKLENPQDIEEQNIEKATKSVSPPALKEKETVTDKSDTSFLDAEKEVANIKKQVDEVSTSPKSMFVHFEEESILLRKLKSPLVNTKNRTAEKNVSPESSIDVVQLEEKTKTSPSADIKEQISAKLVDRLDTEEEEIVDNKCKDSITVSEESFEEKQNLRQSESLQPKSTFSTTESPSTQNIKISDIEVEVRRRSKSPVMRIKSKSPQLLKQTENLTEKTKSQLEIIQNVDETEEDRSKLNDEPSKGSPEKVESSPSECEEMKDLEPQKQYTEDIVKEINSQFKEGEKSSTQEDYVFEIPSDEEAEKTHPPEYDQSTVVASFMASSQLIGDESTSIEMETVVIVSEKKLSRKENCPAEENEDIPTTELDIHQTCIEINDTIEEKSFEEENCPAKENKDIPTAESDKKENCPVDENKDIPTAESEIHQTYIEINDTIEEKSLEEKQLDENDKEEEMIENANIPQKSKIEKELDNDEDSEKFKEVDDSVDEGQNFEAKGESLESLPKLVEFSDEESSSLNTTKKSEELEDEFERYNEEKINNSDMRSPQKKLKVRKYSLKKKMEFYEKDLEKDDEERNDSENEESEDEFISKTKKRSKKRNIVIENDEYEEGDVEKDNLPNDDLETEERSSKKKLKLKNRVQKRKSDAGVENVRKLKKLRKSKEYIAEESENVEETKINEKITAKKKRKPRKSSSSEDFDLEENKESQDSSELTESPVFEELNERKSTKINKKDTTEVSKTTKEKQSQDVKDSTKKSPSSMLDEFITRKIAELSSDEESDSEDENPEEPNEYVCTMAEEGEEDTPSEDSNAIVDEGESVGSTESEYGSDDEYDKNDSFICDDEDEQLLSGEEYDLSNEKTKKKKSRIIQLDNSDNEIEIQKKDKAPPVAKKRTRIITLSDSSESDENEIEIELNKDVQSEEVTEISEETNENQEIVCIEEKTDEEVFIMETKPSRGNLEESPNVSTAESPTFEQRSERKRLSSITFHENINVKEIKGSPLSERISNLVDSFCTTMRKGEISMNLSIECTTKDDDSEDETKRNKSTKKRTLSRSAADEDNTSSEQEDIEEEASYKPPKRLSVSMDSGTLIETKKRAKKKRKLSKSMDNLDQTEIKSKKKKMGKRKKKNLQKKAMKNPKKRTFSEDDLRMQSFGLISQLITDIKNRPRRTVRPSTNMNNSWFTEVVNVKPSTTAFDKEEKAAYKAGKVHPKDFRSQMLNDPSRVRRVDTKTLLKKKGVYL